jgi:translation initiation factor 5A
MEDDDFDPNILEKKEAGSLKKGDHVMLGDKPCKITGISHAKPGKHGSAKAIIKGSNLFDGKTVEKSYGTGDQISCPIIKRNEYLLLGVDDDQLSLLDDDGNQKDDVRMPEKMHTEVKKQIEDFLAEDKQVLVQVTTVLNVDMVSAAREDKE